MAKFVEISSDEKTKKKAQSFVKNVKSEMTYKSELSGDSMSFEWVNEIEFACSYIDNIVRAPRVTLVNDENVVKVEKAKKITVETVKDLSRHTHYIEKINKNDEVQPSKLLDVRSEETFNTYENRFIYTLIDTIKNFVAKKERELENFESKNSKTLQYSASTTNGSEKVNINLEINSKEIIGDKCDNDSKKELDEIKARIKRINQYITSWDKSEFAKALTKAHVALVKPPITKTNLIIKNPNFQIATKLWGYLQVYDLNKNNGSKQGLDSNGNNTLKDILTETFLTDYFVLDSISSTKKEQKEKLAKYAVIMIKNQIQRSVSLLLNSGIKITDEEILAMIAEEIKSEKNKRLVGSNDVKKKFKSAMDEYLERTQSYL